MWVGGHVGGMITESMCTYILKEMGIESRCLNVASKTQTGDDKLICILAKGCQHASVVKAIMKMWTARL